MPGVHQPETHASSVSGGGQMRLGGPSPPGEPGLGQDQVDLRRGRDVAGYLSLVLAEPVAQVPENPLNLSLFL